MTSDALPAAAGTGFPRPGRREPHGLLRRQWPLVAVLALLGVLEVVRQAPWDASRAVLLGCSLVLAVLAPLEPARSAVAGALVIAVASTGLWVAGGVEPAPIPAALVGASLALVACAVRGARPGAAAGAVAAVVAANALFVVLLVELPAADVPALLRLDGSLLALAGTAGLYFRARDRERAAALAAVRQAERLDLARELHDVVAHHVTGIVVHANAARLGTEPGPARESLDRIAACGTEALDAMRRLVGALRPDGAAPDLASELRAVTQRCPVPAWLELSLDRPPPADVARSVLRLVTEALTNVGKHAAGASEVAVRIATTRDGELHVLVVDDGRGSTGAPAGGSGGHGIVGMAERVRLLGGRFSAGATDRGWKVEAWLPAGSR